MTDPPDRPDVSERPDLPEREFGEEAPAYEPSPDDYFQAKQAGFSDPQAQFLLRRFGQPGPDPATLAILTQILARLDQQQETNVEILTRLTRLETQRETDREQFELDRQTDRERYERDRETDRERYERDREEYLRQFAELRQGQRDLEQRLMVVETSLIDLRADVHHLQERTLFENRVWRSVIGFSAAAGAVIGGILAFWK